MNATRQFLATVTPPGAPRRRCALAAAVAAALALPAGAGAQVPPPQDLCRIAPADAAVPLGDGPYASVAVGGPSVKPGPMCTRFVVDVITGTNAKVTLRSRYAGPATGPIDSEADGPLLPLSEAWCTPFRQYVTVYRSYFGQPFQAIASATLKGVWSVYIDSPGPSHCELKVASGDPLGKLESFTSPWNMPATYRVAVSVYSSTAWQPVTVTAAHA